MCIARALMYARGPSITVGCCHVDSCRLFPRPLLSTIYLETQNLNKISQYNTNLILLLTDS